MSNLARVRRMFDHDPGAYHRGMTSRFSEWMLGDARQKVGETVRGRRVLDIGFGTGLSLPHYPATVEITGIDASLEMLRFARSESAKSGRHASLAEMDAEHLAFADGTFDSVAFNLCLCTIGDPQRAVREAIRVAKPGAPMVFLEHVRSHLLPVAAVQEVFSPLLVALQADHFNRDTARTARRAGVEIVSIDRWFAGIFNLIVGRAPGGDRP
ncbi:MAG TPA: class I SAM-dependent methyltransferase [Candidatus Dormibacteraeota bacterium]|nr:class I SAM-dependent methyltransferase [Candidatus Dormibacteraeota bacterium]